MKAVTFVIPEKSDRAKLMAVLGEAGYSVNVEKAIENGMKTYHVKVYVNDRRVHDVREEG